MQRLRLAGEEEERKTLSKKRFASIQARKDVLDAFDEEEAERFGALSLGMGTEIAPTDKAAAFVDQLHAMDLNSEIDIDTKPIPTSTETIDQPVKRVTIEPISSTYPSSFSNFKKPILGNDKFLK